MKELEEVGGIRGAGGVSLNPQSRNPPDTGLFELYRKIGKYRYVVYFVFSEKIKEKKSKK